MFDAIGVSGRTHKPWTVVVSFIGQLAAVGLAILVPLIGTGALPQRFTSVTLPAPPRGLHHRTSQAQATQASAIPPQITPKGVVFPRRIPDKAVMLEDAVPILSAGNGVGVPGGFGEPNGSGNGVIDSLVGSISSAPPPSQLAAKQAAPPAPPKRITVGGNVQKGKLISGPRPVYPQLAMQARIAGTVKLQAVISREGAILDLRAVSGHPLLIPSALAAVQHWTFSPTYLNGVAVEVATYIEVTFTLQN
jgi:periplasmic protein TonB